MPKTSIEDFEKEIATGYEIEIYYIEGNKVIDKEKYVKTNMKMIAKKNGIEVGEYILVVTGDCNGTGTTTVSDLTTVMISIAENLAENKNESKILKGAYERAVDLNRNGKLNAADITELCMFIARNK